jgi:hypothetical protein
MFLPPGFERGAVAFQRRRLDGHRLGCAAQPALIFG